VPLLREGDADQYGAVQGVWQLCAGEGFLHAVQPEAARLTHLPQFGIQSFCKSIS
jgi:hypothetical protein